MQLIERFIKLAEEKGSDAKGGNKHCWLFSTHALLKGSLKEEDLNFVKSRQEELLSEGVSVVPIVDYKAVTLPNELGYSSGYILQRKAEGECLHSSSETKEQYEETLKSLSNEEQGFYDSLVKNWIKIEEKGLQVDPSKSSNFFYEKGKQINFIDLDKSKSGEKEDYRFEEVSVALLGGGKYWDYGGDEKDSVSQKRACKILEKVKNSFVANGYEEERLNQVIIDRFDITPPKNDISNTGVSKSYDKQ